MSHPPQPLPPEPSALVHMQPYRPAPKLPTPLLQPTSIPHPLFSDAAQRERAVRRRDVLSYEQIVAAHNLRQRTQSTPFIPPAPAFIAAPPAAEALSYPAPAPAAPPATDLSIPDALPPAPHRSESAVDQIKAAARERTAIRRPALFNPESPSPSQRAAMQKPRAKLDKHGRLMNINY